MSASLVLIMCMFSPPALAADASLYPANVVDEQNVRTYGYIDGTGNFAIRPQYSMADDFNAQGIAIVHGRDGGCGVIDKSGREIVPPNPGYFSVTVYNGRIMAGRSEMVGEIYETYYDLYDLDGRLIGTYQNAVNYGDGLICFMQRLENGTFRDGYKNEAGDVVIPPQYIGCGKFSNGRNTVLLNDGNCAIIDAGGNVIKEFSKGYDAYIYGYGDWDEGLLPVSNGSNYGYYSMDDGSLVIGHHFLSAGAFQDGYAVASQKTGYGVIDKTGSFVVKPSYNYMNYMGEGRYFASTYDQKRCVLDRNGKRLLTLPGEYPNFPAFQYGLSCYYDLESKKAFIFNTDGKVVRSVDTERQAGIVGPDLIRIIRGGNPVYVRVSDGSVLWEWQRSYEIGGGLAVKVRQYADLGVGQVWFFPYVMIDYPVLSGYKDEALGEYVNRKIADFFIKKGPVGYDGNPYGYQKGDCIFHIKGGVGSFTKQLAYGGVDTETDPYRATLNIDLATGRTYTIRDLFLPGFGDALGAIVKSKPYEPAMPPEGGEIPPVGDDAAFELIDGGIRLYVPYAGNRVTDPGFVCFRGLPFEEIDGLINKNGELWRALTKGSTDAANRAAAPFSDVPVSDWAYAISKRFMPPA